jgi:hypothetical protein
MTHPTERYWIVSGSDDPGALTAIAMVQGESVATEAEALRRIAEITHRGPHRVVAAASAIGALTQATGRPIPPPPDAAVSAR